MGLSNHQHIAGAFTVNLNFYSFNKIITYYYKPQRHFGQETSIVTY